MSKTWPLPHVSEEEKVMCLASGHDWFRGKHRWRCMRCNKTRRAR